MIIGSSYRKLAQVAFEPTTTEFRSDVLTDRKQKTDRKIYFILSFHFGENVLRWCLFVDLFDMPFQISPYGHDEERLNICLRLADF